MVKTRLPEFCPGTGQQPTSMTCQGDRYDAKGHRFFECARTDTATYFTLSGEEVVLCPECADREQRENTI